MSEKIENNICDGCETESKFLYALEIYKQGTAVEFLCSKCHKSKHGENPESWSKRQDHGNWVA
jgi:hypothetical protein